VMSLLPLSHTIYRNGSIQILNTGNLCIDTY
jgi:hypothetical protein